MSAVIYTIIICVQFEFAHASGRKLMLHAYQRYALALMDPRGVSVTFAACYSFSCMLASVTLWLG